MSHIVLSYARSSLGIVLEKAAIGPREHRNQAATRQALGTLPNSYHGCGRGAARLGVDLSHTRTQLQRPGTGSAKAEKKRTRSFMFAYCTADNEPAAAAERGGKREHILATGAPITCQTFR